MRQLSITTFLSIDGVMQAPGGPDEDVSGGFDRGGWVVPHFDEATGQLVDDWFRRAGGIVLGRTTYDAMYPYFSKVGDHDVAAAALNGLPKYVATTTRDTFAWQHTSRLEGDVVEAVRALKSQPGGELQVHGSWQLAQTLIAADLIDVFHLLTFPVVLGEGKRLFPDGTPAGMRLTASTHTPSGVVANVYERSGDVATGVIDVDEQGELVDSRTGT